MSTTVTLVIHGTFASEATWWRLGSRDHDSFADRLERELSRRGLTDTVWKPVLAEHFDYSSFSWSGQNRHGDRVAGARRLSSNLNELARRAVATPSEPMTVNFVAHSHGGNVVLEALRHLKPNVRVGRVVLLGTPLITTRPAFRAMSFIFSACLVTVFVGILTYIPVGLFIRGRSLSDFVSTEWWTVPMLILSPVIYAWMFWLLGSLTDVVWRITCRVGEPLAWLRGKARWLVYGPSPRKLAAILRGGPVLLLTTHNDEADILLQVGSAPG